MQHTRHRLLTVVAILVATNVHSAEIATVLVDTGLTYSYGTRENTSMQAELEIEPAMDVTLSPTALLITSARIRLDQRDALEPGEHAYDSYSRASHPVNLGTAGTVEIRDLYIEWRRANGVTRLGKQQIVWGRLDGLKVLDLINPQDFREFIDDDFNDSRISLWSAYFDYSIGDWRAELAVVPDSSGHVIPESGAWFELTAPRFRFGATAGQGSLPVVTVRPELSVDDTAVGLRVSRQLGSVDFSVVAYSGKDPEPLGRLAAVAGNARIEQFYKRREALGFSFDLGLGQAVLRGEYAYQPDRVFNVRPNGQLASLARDQHRGAIGLDLDGPLGLFFNIQYFADIVSDAPTTLVRPAADRMATLFVRRAFAYDTLTLEARWYHSFTDNDHRVSANIAYAISDATSIELGLRYARGSADGLFGQFEDRDLITVGLRHTF